MDFLHASLNQHEFDLKIEKILKKCHEKKWDKWTAYFNNEWLSKTRFNNWQMFHIKAGYPNTKNAIESFHKILKRIFTSYVKGTVKSLSECLIEKLVTLFKKSK